MTSKALFPHTPDQILPDGVDSALITNPYTHETGNARKGTIAATINNIAFLNKALFQKEDESLKEVITAIRMLIPSLKLTGIFHLFSPLEWLSTDDQPGRMLTVILFLQAYPDEATPALKEKLKDVENKFPRFKEQIDVILGS